MNDANKNMQLTNNTQEENITYSTDDEEMKKKNEQKKGKEVNNEGNINARLKEMSHREIGTESAFY